MTIDSLAGTLSTYWPVVVVAGTTLGTVVGSVLTIWFRLRHERREEKKARREDATSTWDRLKETYDTRIEQLAKLSEDPANPRRERDHQRLLKRRRQFERQISSYQSQQALNRLVPRRSPGEALGVALDHKGRAELTVQLQSARLLTPGALTAADYQAQGDASWTLGRVADALTAYDRSLALRPDDPVTLANRGAVLRQLGRPADAVVSYDRALKLDPDDATVLAWRAWALRALGRYEEAISDLDRAQSLRPHDTEVAKYKSQVFRDVGRYLEAEDSSRAVVAASDRGLAKNPDDPYYFFTRGNALALLGRHEEALADLDRALKVRPNNPDGRESRGLVLAKLGRLPQALEDIDSALVIRPDDPDLLSDRGFVLAQLGRLEEALADLNLAIVIRPHDPDALSRRAHALAEFGRNEEARADLSRTLAIRPNDPGALGLLARLDSSDEVSSQSSEVLA